MFFSYPQWLGQAPDPSMTIPPQPIFRSSSRTRPEKKKAPGVAETASCFTDTIPPNSNASSDHSTHGDSSPGTSWRREDLKTDTESDSNGTSITEEYIYFSETLASARPTQPSEDHPPNNYEYFSAGQSFEPEPASQPPAYQETETYFNRFSDFYPAYPAYVHLPPLNYVHVEHYSLPFPKPEVLFQGWCDNVLDEMYRKDYDTHSPSRDSQQKRATWSSPPFTSSKSKETPPVSSRKEVSPEAAQDTTKKSPKLGTYSFTFFTQRETFPTTGLNRDLKNMSSVDTLKSRSTGTTEAPRKPFVYSKPLTLKAAMTQYEEHWGILLSDFDSCVKWTFHTIPWPQFPPPISIDDINTRRIRRFLLTGNVNTKALLRKALLRFHPDKIPKLLLNVEDKDKEQVSQGCMTVAKCLNEIKGAL